MFPDQPIFIIPPFLLDQNCCCQDQAKWHNKKGAKPQTKPMRTTKSQETIFTLVQGLKNRDPATLEQIYRECYPDLLKYITQNSGNTQDAEDVFQEALVAIYQKLQRDFTPSFSFHAYLFGVGRFIWLGKLKKRKASHSLTEINQTEDPDPTMVAILEQQQKDQFIKEKFQQLGSNCQEVLTLFFQGVKMKDIAHRLEYKSENYAKKRKWQCWQLFLKIVRSDPQFRQLK